MSKISKMIAPAIGIIVSMPMTANALARSIEPPCGLEFKARIGKGERKRNRKHRWD